MGKKNRIEIDKAVKVIDGSHKGVTRTVTRIKRDPKGKPTAVKLHGIPGYINAALVQAI